MGEYMAKMRIGIIGIGKWGKNHLRTFAQLPVHIAGVADRDQGQQEFADSFRTPFYTNYKDLLPLVDAVTVAAPTDLHYDIVKEAFLAGKHAFVEKPATDSAKKTKELVELARAKDLVLSVGYLYRFNPAVLRTKELIPSIGKLQYITMRYTHSTKPPRKDSGAILNLGIHMIDILNFILNERPTRVSCARANYIHPEREDSAHILLDYGAFFASVEVSSCHPEKKRDMWVVAGKEKLYADLEAQRVVRYPINVSEERVDSKPAIEEQIEKKEPLHEELRHFIEHVTKNKEGRQKHFDNMSEEQHDTMRICELAKKSAITGRALILS